MSKVRGDSAGGGRRGKKRRATPVARRAAKSAVLPLPESASLVMLAEDLAVIAFSPGEPQLPSALTKAEQDIALRVYVGQTNQEIARERQSSERTIGNHLEAIYRKLRVGSRTELVLRLRGRTA